MGGLASGQYLIHDRDAKFCAAFTQILDNAGVKRVPLPPRSPHLHAFAERFVRSVKEEALSRFMLFGENALYHVLKEYWRIIMQNVCFRRARVNFDFQLPTVIFKGTR